MSLSARSIAVKGFGYGALAVALAGFVVTTPSGGIPPISRTYRVWSENRRQLMAIESRRYNVVAEYRRAVIATEIRKALVLLENRRILMPLENRRVGVI